ncbi:MAG: VanZ family protein [Clostridia bacterium]
MQLFEILQKLFPWCLLSVLLMLAISLAILLDHQIIHKNTLKPMQPLLTRRLVSTMLLCGYGFIVMGLTVFSRAAGTMGRVNLSLFFGYADAFETGSALAFQLIIFNILMFLPLGFLLPPLSKRLNSLFAVLLCALTFSLLIECTQYFSRTGIFELDDLFHNTLGAVLGYCIYVALTEKSLPRKKHFLSAARAMMAFLVLFSAVSAAYVFSYASIMKEPFALKSTTTIQTAPVQRQHPIVAAFSMNSAPASVRPQAPKRNGSFISQP